MREILFRGKDESGNWIRGEYMGGQIHVQVSSKDEWWGYSVMDGTVSQYVSFDDSHGEKIFEGDIITVCVFFVSPENPDEDIHFKGIVLFIYGSVCISISEFMNDYSGWKKLASTTTGFPLDKDGIEDGVFTIPLFSLCSISGNLGEYSEENVEIIGNIHDNPTLINP